MLRRRGERRELLPAEREEHAARRSAEGIVPLRSMVSTLSPVIASDGDAMAARLSASNGAWATRAASAALAEMAAA